MILRKFSDSDLDAIVSLEKRAFTVGPYTRRMLRHIFDDDSGVNVLAEEGGQIVGYAVILPLNSTQVDLETIAVLPEFQGKGVSQALLKYLEKEASSRGFRQMILEVRDRNDRAISFYRRNGYSTVSHLPLFYREPYMGSRGAFRMSKDLK